jgi:hypothetical protein
MPGILLIQLTQIEIVFGFQALICLPFWPFWEHCLCLFWLDSILKQIIFEKSINLFKKIILLYFEKI